ncbi:hypothetical protein VNO78_26617 [Psophocarpus tetragonolobus]|uniref:Uncharacterized protein n=1 Tax=Psophocarpus tetragonolobus TaxID=3891 RepID=A0AAN9S0F5_PSOTE
MSYKLVILPELYFQCSFYSCMIFVHKHNQETSFAYRLPIRRSIPCLCRLRTAHMHDVLVMMVCNSP